MTGVPLLCRAMHLVLWKRVKTTVAHLQQLVLVPVDGDDLGPATQDTAITQAEVTNGTWHHTNAQKGSVWVCLAAEAFCVYFQWTSAWICFFRTTEPFIYASMLSCTISKMAETCLINGQPGPTANPSYNQCVLVQKCFLLLHTCKKQKGNTVICIVVNWNTKS